MSFPSCTLQAGYYGGDPKLPDGFDHAEAHFNTAVGVVLAGLREAGNAVVAVSQDFDTKTVMLLKGTGWERKVLLADSSVLPKGLERGQWGQAVCTLGSGAPTFEMSLYCLPRKLGGTLSRGWKSSEMESWKNTGFGAQQIQGHMPALPCPCFLI